MKKIKSYMWGLIHNCIAHPLMGLFPTEWATRFHDWTAFQWDLARNGDKVEDRILQEKQEVFSWRKGFAGIEIAPDDAIVAKMEGNWEFKDKEFKELKLQSVQDGINICLQESADGKNWQECRPVPLTGLPSFEEELKEKREGKVKGNSFTPSVTEKAWERLTKDYHDHATGRQGCYQPTGNPEGNIDKTKPPQGGSGMKIITGKYQTEENNSSIRTSQAEAAFKYFYGDIVSKNGKTYSQLIDEYKQKGLVENDGKES